MDFSGIWFIFATNWAFMLLAVTNILHAVIVVQHFLSESNNGKFGSFSLWFNKISLLNSTRIKEE